MNMYICPSVLIIVSVNVPNNTKNIPICCNLVQFVVSLVGVTCSFIGFQIFIINFLIRNIFSSMSLEKSGRIRFVILNSVHTFPMSEFLCLLSFFFHQKSSKPLCIISTYQQKKLNSLHIIISRTEAKKYCGMTGNRQQE